MLDLKNAEKTLTFLTGRIVGKDIHLSMLINNENVTVTSSDISHLVGINFFKSIKISSQSVYYTYDKSCYHFQMTFEHTDLEGASHYTQSFEANLNPDGSVADLTLTEHRPNKLHPSDPQFRKLMTTNDMKSEFFNLLDNFYVKNQAAIRSLVEDRYFFIDSKNSKGETGLHFAVNRRLDINILKTLLSCGANINSRNDNEETPLYVALTRQWESGIEFLLNNDTSFLVNGKGENAIDILRKMKASNPESISTADFCDRFESIIEQKMLEKNIKAQDVLPEAPAF